MAKAWVRSQRQNKVGRSILETGLVLLLLAMLGTGGIANAQEEEEEGDEASVEVPEGDSDEEVELVVVTGSRIARAPSEQSRNVVVLDEQDIKATGELTLYRVLRQLGHQVKTAKPPKNNNQKGGGKKPRGPPPEQRG
ncbi:MAG: hypothetical protein OXP28_13200, partial [Gammaproteobacteria bacterium]|nr:hypothetical protein [Gammaproteobacteria bacterium]